MKRMLFVLAVAALVVSVINLASMFVLSRVGILGMTNLDLAAFQMVMALGLFAFVRHHARSKTSSISTNS